MPGLGLEAEIIRTHGLLLKCLKEEPRNFLKRKVLINVRMKER